MNNKSQIRFRKTLICLAILIAIFCLYLVSAWSDNGTATQNVDGCNTLNTTNAVYTLTSNVSSTSTCFTIAANNITLNCQGYTIDGNDGSLDYGVDNYVGAAYDDLTIKNCQFTDWDIGIWSGGDSITLLNINSSSNSGNGIRLEHGSDHNLTNIRTISNGQYSTSGGIYLSDINDSSFTNIVSNSNSKCGIDMTYSSNRNTFRNLYISNNDNYGIVAELSSRNNYYEDVITTDNKAGIVINAGSDHTVIINITSYSNSDATQGIGIWVVNSTNISVSNATSYSNAVAGLYLHSLTSSSFTNIESYSNTGSANGLIMYYVNSSNFTNINVHNNGNNGLNLVGSSLNNFMGANVTSNGDGIWIQASVAPVVYSANNSFLNIISTGNDHGIYIGNSSYNTVTNSTFRNSTSYGIRLKGSPDNLIYNNLFNNTVNVGFTNIISYNSWNVSSQTGTRIISSGTNIGGNYYTNSSGTGYSNTCTDDNTDGFCDSAYDLINNTAGCTSSNCDYLTYSDDYLLDIIAPDINFTNPTPSNSSNQTNNNIFVNVTANDSASNISTFIDFDNSLVGWWRMDDVNATTGVIDYMGRNNGTAFGNASQTDAGKLGKGMSFDGILAWLGFNLKETCSSDMAYIDKLGGYCIDKYEASTPGCTIVGNNCANYTHADYCPTICIPTVGVLGGVNSATGTTAVAYSVENVAPLVGVSQKQARQMCANAGKYLCTSSEWLGASNIKGQMYNLPSNLKDAPYRCVTDSTTYCNYAGNSNKACNTTLWSGGKSNCTSSEGVYDMTGNVWEWTNESVDVINPMNNASGGYAGYYYINTTDLSWSLSTTADTGKYGKDGTYFPINSTSVRAVQRGGSWDYGAHAGPFCAYLSTAPSNAGRNIGFRCCSGQG